MGKTVRILRRLLFPPRCAACGQLLDDAFSAAPRALCAPCLVKWDAQKQALCHCCGEPVTDCKHPVNAMSKHGIGTLIKLVEYEPQKRSGVGNRVVFLLKDRDNAELQAFLAAELAPSIYKQLAELGHTPADAVLVWAPRSKRAERERGFDQSKRLCTSLARELGMPKPVQMIRRTGGRVQKMLGEEQRRKNAFSSFEAIPKHCTDLKGKCVVLVDDVVTTGSTLSACAAKLKPYKPATVIGVCVATDAPQNNQT